MKTYKMTAEEHARLVNDLRIILNVTTDLYLGRNVTYDRLNRYYKVIEKYEGMTFKRLIRNSLLLDYVICGREVWDYLNENYTRDDNMSKIVRSLL